jgi:putative DNA primase/helicase
MKSANIFREGDSDPNDIFESLTIEDEVAKEKEKDPGWDPELFKKAAEQEFPFGDLGASMRFVYYFGDIIRYNHTLDRWHIWKDGVWGYDKNGKIIEYIKMLYHYVGAEESYIERGKNTKKLIDDYASLKKSLLSEHRENAAISLSRSDPKIAKTNEDFDQDKMIINLKNGIYDLDKMEFLSHDPQKHCTKIANASYDLDAECPEWIKFLDLIFEKNEEIISYIQRWFGYYLTGLTREKAFVLAYGDVDNGKTTFASAIQYLLGDYGTSAQFKSLIAPTHNNPSGHRSDLVGLNGARFVSVPEGAEKWLDSGLIKQITGYDDIVVRAPYATNDFVLDNQMKLFIYTNKRPKIDIHDQAMWARIHEVHFNVYIPGVVDVDPSFHEKLYEEVDGIFNWALEGWQVYKDDGYVLKKPESVENNAKEHLNELDFLSPFFSERCETGLGLQIGSDKLRQHANEWLEKNGYKKPLTRYYFDKEMKARGFEKLTDRTGTQWLGIDVKIYEIE